MRSPCTGHRRAPTGSLPLAGAGLANSATARLSFDGRFGYLSGDVPADGLAVTTDGGASWSQRTLPCPPGRDAFVRVAPFGGGELDVVCSATGAGGQYAKSQFFSVDGATTFHLEPVTPPADGGLDDLAAPGPGGLVMATASAGSTLFEQQGETWAEVAHPVTGGIHWHDLGFTTESQGVAVLGDQPGPGDEGAGLYMTRDGGRTWAVVDFGVAALPPPCTAGQLTVNQPPDQRCGRFGQRDRRARSSPTTAPDRAPWTVTRDCPSSMRRASQWPTA